MESWEQMINLHQAVTMLRNESGNQVHYHLRDEDKGLINDFPVWLRNRLTSAGLATFLSHTEKS